MLTRKKQQKNTFYEQNNIIKQTELGAYPYELRSPLYGFFSPKKTNAAHEEAKTF